MALSFGGRFTGNSALPPANTGLNKYAQERLNNTVSRAIAKNANALSVDGIYFNVWVKSNSGIVCTCSQSGSGSLLDSLKQTSPDVNATNRARSKSGNNTIDALSSGRKDNFDVFTFSTNDQEAFLDSSNLEKPAVALDFNTTLDTSVDSLNKELLLNSLSSPVSDDDLARLVSASASGSVYGGDKTACGICFSTGFVNGYTLSGGARVIMDASFTLPFTCSGGAVVDRTEHPYKFKMPSTGAVTWTVDLSPYVLQWLNIAINNNLQNAQDLQMQMYFNDAWQEVTLGLLLALSGTNTAGLQIRVVPNPQSHLTMTDIVEFTHAEISFMLTEPTLGQAPQLPYAMNYDTLEPLIQTNFELLPTLPSLPRETILQDSRTNYLWKVTSVTPKITANGQLFGYDVDVRKVASLEALYRLVLPFSLPTAPNRQLPGA